MSQSLIKVVLESPYSGDVAKNVQYTLECMHDSHRVRREAPIASHLLYTRYPDGHLDDTDEAVREHGIQSGFAWNQHADLVAVYTDNGITRGMRYGIAFAEERGIPVVYRKLYSPREKPFSQP